MQFYELVVPLKQNPPSLGSGSLGRDDGLGLSTTIPNNDYDTEEHTEEEDRSDIVTAAHQRGRSSI
jgi:hypothetical protein